jgi:hypothetical protein
MHWACSNAVVNWVKVGVEEVEVDEEAEDCDEDEGLEERQRAMSPGAGARGFLLSASA